MNEWIVPNSKWLGRLVRVDSGQARKLNRAKIVQTGTNNHSHTANSNVMRSKPMNEPQRVSPPQSHYSFIRKHQSRSDRHSKKIVQSGPLKLDCLISLPMWYAGPLLVKQIYAPMYSQLALLLFLSFLSTWASMQILRMRCAVTLSRRWRWYRRKEGALHDQQD
jgi:hypothetical protein